MRRELENRKVHVSVALSTGHALASGIDEIVLPHNRGRYAPTLQVYRVEHTARRTGSSVPDPDDHRVDPGGEIIDNFGWRGIADKHFLREVDVREVVFLVQYVRDVLEQDVAADLVVPQQAEPLVG